MSKSNRYFGYPTTLLVTLLLFSTSGRITRSAPAASHVSKPNAIILAGKSVGLLELGDTRERVLELFPKRKNQDFEWDYPYCGQIKEIHWPDFELQSSGVFVYLRDGYVFQIEAQTPRFQTPEGITVDSQASLVRRHYHLAEAHVLKSSGGKEVGGRDLIYWVNREKGIAFEFRYHRQRKRRVVGSVIVFRTGTEFFPQGCIVVPQEWHKLPAYALEPSKR